ncbi:MAG: Limonene,2-epoxide hydrolase catalytic domain [Gaiellales bacterium]|jgi:ketosteroid isomerase-like protein|nr:Limonene,2-epoxide hydrolase catalytic domain [Gaiellales bacterium]
MTPGEAIQRVFQGWEQSDAASVSALFGAEGRYEDPLFPEAAVGPKAIREAIAPAMDDITDLRITILRQVENDNVGIVEAEFRCALASGEGRLDFDFAMIVEMEDGHITRLAEYFDTRPLV